MAMSSKNIERAAMNDALSQAAGSIYLKELEVLSLFRNTQYAPD